MSSSKAKTLRCNQDNALRNKEITTINKSTNFIFDDHSELIYTGK